MRTLVAALSVALLASVAHVPDAAACGGGYGGAELPPLHTAEGTLAVGQISRTDQGDLVVFLSYPVLDGQKSSLYVGAYVLRDNPVARTLARELAADRRRGVRVLLERRGERGPWHVARVTRGPRDNHS